MEAKVPLDPTSQDLIVNLSKNNKITQEFYFLNGFKGIGVSFNDTNRENHTSKDRITHVLKMHDRTSTYGAEPRSYQIHHSACHRKGRTGQGALIRALPTHVGL